MGMTRVSNLKARAALLVVGLLATLLVLALSACGGAGGQEEAKARSLPLYPSEKGLRPGEYHPVKFKPPLSFKVGKDWSNTADQLSAFIELGYEGGTGVNNLSFANVKEVFKPGTTDVVDAPQDLVGWLQKHPYLKTSKPQPVTLGGVKGVQFEVLVEELPKDYNSLTCSADCVDIAPLSNGQAAAYFSEVNKRRVFVLEDVKGDTVMIWFGAPPDEFDEFATEAQKVVDSVKWSGS
jgi:hypothetical protein